MNNHNGAKKLWAVIKIPGVILTCLIIMATLGRWYMVYANSTAVFAESLKTHTKEILNLEENQKEMRKADLEQTKILIALQEFFRATQGREWRKASESADSILIEMNNKDTIPDTLNTNEYLTTDSLGYLTTDTAGDSL